MIIGRKEEQKILLSAAESEYSELIAVYGRCLLYTSHMAQMMSQMVFIIPAIPRVAISSVNMSLSVCRLVLP